MGILSRSGGIASDVGDPIGFPGYYAGEWFTPNLAYTASGSAAANPGNANKMTLSPLHISQKCTISTLAVLVIAAGAGGTFSIAIYANDPTINKPTGAPLATCSGSTASAITVQASLSASLQLKAGVYWMAFAISTTSATFAGVLNNDLGLSICIGSSTLNDLFSSSTPLTGFQFTSTGYAVFPTFTSSSSFSAWIGSLPRVAALVASVP